MPNEPLPQSSIILYQTEDGRTRIQCRFENETIWLTQAQIAELFQKDVRTINEHLLNIFEEDELSREATIRKFRIVRLEGAREVKREVEHYRLEAIIAVGYRVNSYQATQFRIWATRTLKEFIIKGFVMDDERLKQGGQAFGKDYFEELLERIREKRRRLVGVLDARSRVTGARRVRSQVAASNQIRQNSNRGGISQMRFSEDASALKREFDTIVWLLSDQEPAEIELFESSAKS
jgi:hypothetical protein